MRTHQRLIVLLSLLTLGLFCTSTSRAAEEWIDLKGGGGPGHGKKIVLLSGDEEYRSEEGLPQLAKILSARHGFDCRVLFSINPADGTIDPTIRSNAPGIEALDDAEIEWLSE